MRAIYGLERYDRLAAIKKQYDPRNLFRMNHNINAHREQQKSYAGLEGPDPRARPGAARLPNQDVVVLPRPAGSVRVV